jgi:FtsZ-interacting cell division protein ZipA
MIRENIDIEVAVLISLLLHAVAFGSWQYRITLSRFPLFKPLAKMVILSHERARHAAPKLQTITFVEVQEPAAKEERSKRAQQFIETDTRQVTGEQPQDAKLYSDRATVAANPDNPTGQIGDTPYVEGKETRFLSTEDVTLQPRKPAAPVAPPTPMAAQLPARAVKPKAEQPKEVADMGLSKAEEKKVAMLAEDLPLSQPFSPPSPALAVSAPPPSVGGASPGREIGAVKSQLTASGVTKKGVTAFNVAESPFGEYDKKIVRAVQSRWYALIQRYGIYERAGTVVLHFELHDDGAVRNLSRTENSAGEILALFCEKAVVDSAPFEPLPETLRALVGKEPREVNFTFYY